MSAVVPDEIEPNDAVSPVMVTQGLSVVRTAVVVAASREPMLSRVTTREPLSPGSRSPPGPLQEDPVTLNAGAETGISRSEGHDWTTSPAKRARRSRVPSARAPSSSRVAVSVDQAWAPEAITPKSRVPSVTVTPASLDRVAVTAPVAAEPWLVRATWRSTVSPGLSRPSPSADQPVVEQKPDEETTSMVVWWGRMPWPLTVRVRVPVVRGSTASDAEPSTAVNPADCTWPSRYTHTRAPSTGTPPISTMRGTTLEPSSMVVSTVTAGDWGTPRHMSVAGSPMRLFQIDQISTMWGSARK